ncbi:uncharacterized protein SCDLUD_004885 [Saccharomycodes ludwigii]|uniref:uncharacterized protein n=1 Tax=Saccharomycodes ludwigii TaxID=36035 RepID=UPI001E89679B|nr:hypothetical protein SCDLUD_004885 [Saccharomycodes ludwigii]KAH3899442.1 hypothetical protein SCDLUD_004885 [Saccharomycodes ludwigii]
MATPADSNVICYNPKPHESKNDNTSNLFSVTNQTLMIKELEKKSDNISKTYIANKSENDSKLKPFLLEQKYKEMNKANNSKKNNKNNNLNSPEVLTNCLSPGLLLPYMMESPILEKALKQLNTSPSVSLPRPSTINNKSYEENNHIPIFKTLETKKNDKNSTLETSMVSRRNYILNEIILTEMKYVVLLKILQKGYLTKLVTNAKGNYVPFKLLNYLLKELYNIHTRLLRKIVEILEELNIKYGYKTANISDSDSMEICAKIAQVITNMGVPIYWYQKYTVNYELVLLLLNKEDETEHESIRAQQEIHDWLKNIQFFLESSYKEFIPQQVSPCIPNGIFGNNTPSLSSAQSSFLSELLVEKNISQNELLLEKFNEYYRLEFSFLEKFDQHFQCSYEHEDYYDSHDIASSVENSVENARKNNNNGKIAINITNKAKNKIGNSNLKMDLSFSSLVQTPISRISKYKLFLQQLLIFAEPDKNQKDIESTNSYKREIATSLNQLLSKLEKVNDLKDYFGNVDYNMHTPSPFKTNFLRGNFKKYKNNWVTKNSHDTEIKGKFDPFHYKNNKQNENSTQNFQKYLYSRLKYPSNSNFSKMNNYLPIEALGSCYLRGSCVGVWVKNKQVEKEGYSPIKSITRRKKSSSFSSKNTSFLDNASKRKNGEDDEKCVITGTKVVRLKKIENTNAFGCRKRRSWFGINEEGRNSNAFDNIIRSKSAQNNSIKHKIIDDSVENNRSEIFRLVAEQYSIFAFKSTLVLSKADANNEKNSLGTWPIIFMIPLSVCKLIKLNKNNNFCNTDINDQATFNINSGDLMGGLDTNYKYSFKIVFEYKFMIFEIILLFLNKIEYVEWENTLDLLITHVNGPYKLGGYEASIMEREAKSNLENAQQAGFFDNTIIPDTMAPMDLSVENISNIECIDSKIGLNRHLKIFQLCYFHSLFPFNVIFSDCKCFSHWNKTQMWISGNKHYDTTWAFQHNIRYEDEDLNEKNFNVQISLHERIRIESNLQDVWSNRLPMLYHAIDTCDSDEKIKNDVTHIAGFKTNTKGMNSVINLKNDSILSGNINTVGKNINVLPVASPNSLHNIRAEADNGTILDNFEFSFNLISTAGSLQDDKESTLDYFPNNAANKDSAPNLLLENEETLKSLTPSNSLNFFRNEHVVISKTKSFTDLFSKNPPRSNHIQTNKSMEISKDVTYTNINSIVNINRDNDNTKDNCENEDEMYPKTIMKRSKSVSNFFNKPNFHLRTMSLSANYNRRKEGRKISNVSHISNVLNNENNKKNTTIYTVKNSNFTSLSSNNNNNNENLLPVCPSPNFTITSLDELSGSPSKVPSIFRKASLLINNIFNSNTGTTINSSSFSFPPPSNKNEIEIIFSSDGEIA